MPVDAKPGIAGQSRAQPGAPVDRGPCIASKRCENGAFLMLFRLDLYENPILQGSKRLPYISFQSL